MSITHDQARANLAAALKGAVELLSTKSYDEYRSRLWRAAVRLFNGGKDRNFLGSFARSIDQQLTEAWNEGAASVGVMPEDMTDEDMAVLNDIIDSENSFLDGMGGDIADARDAGMTREDFDSQFGARVDTWANRYNDVVNQAKVYFGGKQRLEWVYGDTEHCDTCDALNGVVAWASEWAESDYHPQQPPNDALDCGGWRCSCTLQPTDKRRTLGGIPSV